MKKILCAVDFSGGSVHALDYAIHVARTLHADIELVWVDNSTESSGLAAISRDLRLEVKKQFDELIQAREKELGGGKLSYKLKKGKVYQEIAALAKSENAELIIAGSHGVSGFEQYWIGSNAYRIVSYAPVPVITVRTDFVISRGVRRIVMPIDSTAETRMKVAITAGFAKAFGAEVLGLALFSDQLKSIQRKVESNLQAACKELRAAGVNVTCNSRNGENITASTISFAEEQDADMIAIMTEKDTARANIMLGHYAQQMVNNSPVPVLSMNAGIKTPQFNP